MTNLKKLMCTYLEQAHAVMKKIWEVDVSYCKCWKTIGTTTEDVYIYFFELEKMSTFVKFLKILIWCTTKIRPVLAFLNWWTISTLLHLATSPSHTIISSSTIDPSVLASQTTKNSTFSCYKESMRKWLFSKSQPKCSCRIAWTYSWSVLFFAWSTPSKMLMLHKATWIPAVSSK